MKFFKVWYTVDGQTYMTNWTGNSKEEVLDDFWEWAGGESGYNVVRIDCVEEIE